jgi:hypothetical protein
MRKTRGQRLLYRIVGRGYAWMGNDGGHTSWHQALHLYVYARGRQHPPVEAVAERIVRWPDDAQRPQVGWRALTSLDGRTFAHLGDLVDAMVQRET